MTMWVAEAHPFMEQSTLQNDNNNTMKHGVCLSVAVVLQKRSDTSNVIKIAYISLMCPKSFT